MHVNCADFVYKAMGELIQVLYHFTLLLSFAHVITRFFVSSKLN